eukprot:4622624-Ditylum_brightwellii.AAC.2
MGKRKHTSQSKKQIGRKQRKEDMVEGEEHSEEYCYIGCISESKISPLILNNISKQSLYVLTAVEEVEDIEDIVLTEPSRKNEDGYALLMMATHDSIKDQSRLLSNLIKDLHQAKHNIIKKGQQHFELSREAFSFEMRCRYYTTNGVPLGKYSSK